MRRSSGGSNPVFLFTFLGMGAGPYQLGKKVREILELGKIAREIILKFSY